MKKYYKIENQIDTQEVGLNLSSQTDGLVGNATFNSEHSFKQFTHHNLPEDFNPTETIKLANSAKQTDFISTGLITGNGFIVSKRLKDLLENFKIVDHKFYHIPILHRQSKVSDYFWFHMYSPKQEYIDFENSTFQVKKFSKVIEDNLKFDSIDDYWAKRKNYKPGQLFRIKEVKLKQNDFDFLYLGVGGSTKLISKELNEKLNEMKITGYKVSEWS